MRAARWWAGGALLAVSVVLVARAVDIDVLRATAARAASDPVAVAAVLVAYAASFVLRAALWRRVLPALPFPHALAALHVSLAGNHVLPLRLGEALRVTSVVRRARIPFADAAASALTLRAADVVAVVVLAVALSPAIALRLAGPALWAVALAALAAAVGGAVWLRRLARSARRVRPPGVLVAVGALVAWLFESAVMWQAAQWAGLEVSAASAVLVTAMTIVAQVVAIAPAGIGTYEAAATAAFVALGFPPAGGLAAALAAHTFKTAHALASGAVAAFVPAPGLAGRLRLPAPGRGPAQPAASPPAGAPVVLFLPAHNEEATVGGVLRRTPDAVCGRRVVRVVVDDGSTDATARVSASNGAHVVSLGENRGLGAAVRRGFCEAAELDAAVVAFCDADGEYDPAQLEDLVAPILDGRADYVVGTRFPAPRGAARPHRRVGNAVLTTALTFVARTRIRDGQSGYRALSAAAAADAEIIHDFNYAQVLTLDLLAKGYRYAEVPIRYRFRTHGESFIRLGAYLRAVVPAVHRELNTA